MLKYILSIFVLFYINITIAQGSLLRDATPFCSDNGAEFPNTYNDPQTGPIGVQETLPDFGCLFPQLRVNPTWYFLKMLTPGDLNLKLQSYNLSNNLMDTDYISWGPYSEDVFNSIITNGDGRELTGDKIVSCAYTSNQPYEENLIIEGALIDQYYIVLVTNYTGSQGYSTLTELYPNQPNTGTTECFINDPPLAFDDIFTLEEDTFTELNVLSNDTDPDPEGTLSHIISGYVYNGLGNIEISADEKVINYTPALDFNGTEMFTYTMSDGEFTSDATVSITVTAVNDAPVAVSDTATVEEDSGLTSIDVISNDTDVEGDTLTLTAANPDSSGTATVNADGVSIDYTPAANFNGTGTITYTVSDGTATSTGTLTVTVTAVNDAPVAIADTATVLEDSALTNIDIISNDTDVDVTDTLTLITAIPDSNGTVSVNADGVSIDYTPSSNFNGTEVITYTVSDGTATSTGTLTITVTAVNDAPVAVSDTAIVDEDTSLTVDVISNDTDVEGDTLTLTAATPDSSGTVSVNADGVSIDYTPAANFNGTGTITYTVSDGTATSTGTLTVTVTAVNDAPVAIADTATVLEDSALTNIDIISNDTDVDVTDTLTLITAIPDSNGTVSVNADGVSIDYTPSSNFNGTEVITYTVSDGTATSTGTLTITVTAVNDAPVAVSDTAIVDEDTSLTVDVISNDTDVEGDTLTLTAANPDSSGTATVNADGVSIDYTPAANFNGTGTITYTVSDGTATSTGTLTVTVTAVNDAPVAIADTATVLEDSALTNIDIISNDTDVDVTDTLTLITAIPDSNGTVSVNADGVSIDYTPSSNFNGTEVITYTVSDGTATSTGTLTITVTAVNDAPVAVSDTAIVDEDTSLTVDVISNDTDVEGDTLTLTAANPDSSGTATVNADGVSIDYTPAANFNGTGTITYTVSDGTATSTGTLTVTVTAVNDAPVAIADTATVLEDSALTNIDIISNDTDVDVTDTLTLITAIPDSNGTVSVNADGVSIDYTPSSNFNGTEVITYTVSDGTATSTGTLTITVTAVNDAPVAVSDTAIVDEDTSLTVDVISNDTDVEGDTLTLTAATPDSSGTVSVNADGVSIDYTPAANFNGTGTITYTVSDGTDTSTGTLTVTVTAVNDAPVAIADTATVLEDSALTNIDIISNDTDVDVTDTLTLITAIPDVSGTVSINADGVSIDYTPSSNFNGTEVITYTVSDGTATSTGTLTVTVTAVNDAPVAVSDTAIVDEDTSLTVDVISNDTDVDITDTLTLAAATPDVSGTVSVNADGVSIDYTPAANFNGTGTITYTVSDGTDTSTGTLTVTVTAVNDAPVAIADTATVLEDSALTNIDIISNDTDVDVTDTLTLITATPDVSGTVSVNADGVSIDYTPAADFNGAEVITYTVSDGTATSTGTLTVTVTAVNDAPVAVSDTATVLEDSAITNIDVVSNDTDVEGDTLTLTAATPDSSGTVSVNADGVSVDYTPAANFNGTGTITYTVSDGTDTSTGTLIITVTAVNDAPVAIADTATVLEDSALTNIDIVSNDTDVDITDTLTLTAAIPDVSGTVSVNADGVSVDYTPAADFNGAEVITYTVSDGTATSTGTLTITVTAVNDAPVAIADTASVEEDAAITNINVILNDTDVDITDTLTLTTAIPDSNGTVSVNADGVSVDYTPAADFNGAEVITYTVSDGTDTSTGTLTITVTAVNDAPVAIADTATVLEDSALTNIDIVSNDTDVEGDTLTLTVATTDGSGTVSVNADGVSVDYTPAANFNGTETITYTVSDGELSDTTGTLTITVTAVNDAPVAIADTASVAEDTALMVDVISNDTDVDVTDTLTLITAIADGFGTVSVNADGVSVDYTPAANFNGTETITYIVSDGTDTSTGTLTITVTAVNDAPVAVSDTATVLEDSALTNINVVSNDTDVEGDTLTLTVATTDGSGTVSVNADGLSVDYTPAANFDGIEVITYAVSDGVDSDDTGILTITVTAIPEAPVAVSDIATLLEDADLTSVNVVSNDTDIDGDSLTLIEVNTDGTGTVTVNTDGVSVDYTPASNFNGTEIVTYIVSDGLLIDQGTLTLTITPVNDPPVAVSDTATLLEDSALTSIDVILNDMDVEGDTLMLVAATTDGSGTVAVNTDGVSVDYTPAPNFNGTETITYTVSDGVDTDETGILTIMVTAVNDFPIAIADSATVDEDASLTSIDVISNDTDLDIIDTLTLIAVTTNGSGTIAVNTDGLSVDYTPASNFNGTETITYTLFDGTDTTTGTLTITVTPVNDAPVAVLDSATLSEDSALTSIDVILNDMDVEGDTLMLVAATTDGSGTVAVNTDGVSVDYTPAPNFNGTETITYTVSDGVDTDETGILTIIVTAVNDISIAIADSAIVDEDTPLTSIDVIYNDTDLDIIDTLTLIAVTTDGTGTVAVNTDGVSVDYTPASNFNGTETITYTLFDGTDTTTGTLTIIVTPVNDLPVAVSDTATLLEDSVLTSIDVISNDTDVDIIDTLTLISATTNGSGTIAINADRLSINYTPVADFNGTETITYTVSDGTDTSIGILSIIVIPVNDSPIAVDDTYNVIENNTLISIDIIANDTDVDGDYLTLMTVITDGTGTVAVNTDGVSVDYLPAENFNGTETIYYTVSDGELIDEGKLTIIVVPVDDFQLVIPALDFPSFFTPNGDGINDTWNIKWVDTNNYFSSEVYIYNRFGKVVAKLNLNEQGWDGTYNGKTLPSGDYWVTVKLIPVDTDKKIIFKTGNFSLLRR